MAEAAVDGRAETPGTVDPGRFGASPTDATRHHFSVPATAAPTSPIDRRTRGTLELMTINREKPSIEVQVIVWVGLAILLAAVGAFVWLFVLGHGFDFPF